MSPHVDWVGTVRAPPGRAARSREMPPQDLTMTTMTTTRERARRRRMDDDDNNNDDNDDNAKRGNV